MITLITGAPGSGKTCALVDLLTQLAKDRPIYVDGIPDLKVGHVPLEDARKWPELVPDGAAIVIDEVQRVWRPAGSASQVPKDIALLETHRHRGLDFFIVTQHPNLLHANVRRLVGRHVHIRDLGVLGRKWYEWPEAADPATFRSAPIVKGYRLSKAAQGLYTSASIHVKPVRSFPRALVVAVLAGAAAIACAGRIGWVIMHKTDAQPAAPAQAAAVAPALPKQMTAAPTPSAAVTAASSPQAAASRPVLAGCISMRGRCSCIDRQGWPVIVEWELCKTTAATYAGLVPLSVEVQPGQAVQPPPQPQQQPQQPEPMPVLGIAAREMREGLMRP